MSTSGKQHKHAAVIKAWADGAQVQRLHGGCWQDVGGNGIAPPFYERDEYRVKPEALVKDLYVGISPTTHGVLIGYPALKSQCNVVATFDKNTGALLDIKQGAA